MQISETVILLGLQPQCRKTFSIDLHNSLHPTQPYSIIANYAVQCDARIHTYKACRQLHNHSIPSIGGGMVIHMAIAERFTSNLGSLGSGSDLRLKFENYYPNGLSGRNSIQDSAA